MENKKTIDTGDLISDALDGPMNIGNYLDQHNMGSNDVKNAEDVTPEQSVVQVEAQTTTQSKDIFDDTANEIADG